MARFFIDRPIFAWVIAIVIMLAGALSIQQLPVSQYPSIAPPAIHFQQSGRFLFVLFYLYPSRNDLGGAVAICPPFYFIPSGYSSLNSIALTIAQPVKNIIFPQLPYPKK